MELGNCANLDLDQEIFEWNWNQKEKSHNFNRAQSFCLPFVLELFGWRILFPSSNTPPLTYLLSMKEMLNSIQPFWEPTSQPIGDGTSPDYKLTCCHWRWAGNSHSRFTNTPVELPLSLTKGKVTGRHRWDNTPSTRSILTNLEYWKGNWILEKKQQVQCKYNMNELYEFRDSFSLKWTLQGVTLCNNVLA